MWGWALHTLHIHTTFRDPSVLFAGADDWQNVSVGEFVDVFLETKAR